MAQKQLAEKVKLPAEQLCFWTMSRRQNNTVRIDAALEDDSDKSTSFVIAFFDDFSVAMEAILDGVSKVWPELRLYMEFADHKVQDADGSIVYFPRASPEIELLFVKYYDLELQKFEFLGSMRLKRSLRGTDLTSIFNELKKFPPNTALRIYEACLIA